MCGIAGYVRIDGPAPELTVLRAMASELIHRGPDGEGVFIDNQVGLVHRRLSVIDLNTGDNPVYNEDRSICTILNGEIYNYRELRKTLRNRGHEFSTESDTEVIVHLYEEHGNDFVKHLNGMFAFALYDLKQRKLILARDRIGKKPIYYYFDNNCFTFASEIQALRCIPGLRLDVDLESLVEFFRYQYIPTPRSVFKQVRKLEPATYLVLQNGSLRSHNYWSVPDEKLLDNPDFNSVQEDFLNLLTECVRCRMIADVPLGAFLSGGIDSTTIVYLMSQIANSAVKTFTIGFDSESYDESSSASHVARGLETDHALHKLGKIPLDDLPNILSRFGEPFGDSSAVPTYYLCEAARQHVTVALSGDGSDEVLGGYNRYLAGALSKYYFRMPAAVRPNRLEPLVGWLPESKRYYGTSNIKKIKQFARFLDNLQDSGQLPSPRSFTDRELKSLLEFPIPVGSDDPVMERDRLASHLDFPARMLSADCRSYLPDDIFVKTDRMSMAHALEVRSPFVDYRLIEFLFRLPTKLKINRGKTKILLKETMGKVFPEIVGRKKHGFEAPIAEWLAGPLRDPLENMVRADNTGVLKKKYVLELIKRHGEFGQDHAKQLWLIYVYLNWAQQDRRPAI